VIFENLYFTTSTSSSVATQLRCGISNHFIKNFPQNVQVKKRAGEKTGQYLAKIRTKVCCLLLC